MFKDIVEIALREDCALYDITSDLTIPQDRLISFEIRSREQIIFCGKEVITEVFKQLKSSAKFKNSKLDLQILAKDGDVVASGKSIARGVGDARLIFAAERVILNLVQHLSGVATLTNKFIKKLNNKKITILDTRKTLPGLRDPAKYAVKVGGGKNHRRDLSAMILIKDNHIAAAGSVSAVLLAAKKAKGKKVEIECDTLQQVVEAAESKPDVIMLDNMSVAQIRKSVELIRKVSKKIQIEISGGVRLSNIKKFSKLDVDYISIGALTHCAPAVDIGLDSK